jgi:hypothetical protein
MPRWVPGPDGSPIYVDESGAPASPFGGNAGTAGLDPAALYGLAQYNSPGYSSEAPTPSVTRDPAAAPVPLEPAADPSSTPQASPAPEAPSPIAAAPLAPPPGGRVSEGYSVSENQAGFSTPKYAEVDRTARGLPGEINQDRAYYDARADELSRAGGHAAAQARESALEQARINAEAATAEGQQRLVLKALNDSFAVEEQNAYNDAKAAAATTKANYEAALAEFRGAGPIDTTRVARTGSGMFASFAAGFLTAGGVKNEVMDTLNKTIDRDINSQVEAIRRKGEVAQGFKTLWDMQRAESANDAEARTRVRGFMLAAAKDQIAAEMSKYDSQLATARGQEAIAKINQELVKTLTEVYKNADDNALRAAQQRISIWQTKVNAALQREGYQVQRDKMAADAAAAKAAGKDVGLERVVRDEKGNVVGFADTKEQKIKLQEQVTGADAVQRRLLELEERMRKAGSEYQGKGYKAFMDGEGAQLRSVYNDLLADIIRAKTGAAATKEERANLEQILPFNSFTTGLFTGELPAESVASRFGVRSIDDIRTNARAQLRPPSAAEVEQYRGGAGGELYDPQRTAQDITARGDDKAADTPAQKAADRVSSPGAGRAVDGSPAQLKDWYEAGLGAIGNDIRGKKGDDRKLSPDEVPDWFTGMAELGDLAARGDESAIQELTRYATRSGVGASPLDQQMDAAATFYLIKTTGSGPQDPVGTAHTGNETGLDFSRFYNPNAQ